MYKNQLWEIRMNVTFARMPILTQRLASFLPKISLMMSVARKVEAKMTLPSVVSSPKAWTRMSTSMLAAMVQMTVQANIPCLPKKRKKATRPPKKAKMEAMRTISFCMVISSCQ